MCWSLDANDGRAARAARKSATDILRAFTTNEETLSAAELVIGELLSNATRHADGHVCLELSHIDGHAQVTVHDTSATFELDVSRPPDDYSEHGRGLFLISELARRVSVVPHSWAGKRVSVTLDIPVSAGEAFEPSCARSWLHESDGVCLGPRLARYDLGSGDRPDIGVRP